MHGLEHRRRTAQRGLHGVDPDRRHRPVEARRHPQVDRRPVAAPSRHQRGVAMHHHLHRLVLEGAEHGPLLGRCRSQHRQGLVGLGREHDMVEQPLVGTGRPQAQAPGLGPHRFDRDAAAQTGDAFEQACRHGVGAVEGAPHALARQPAGQVVDDHGGRELPCRRGAAGAHRAHRRQQEAFDEGLGEPGRLDEFAQAQAGELAAPPGRHGLALEVQQPGHDAPRPTAPQVLRRHQTPAGITQAQVAVAEVQRPALIGERRGITDRLAADAEFGIQPGQRRVVARVEHAQGHVDARRGCIAQPAGQRDRAGDEAGLGLAFVQRHPMALAEQPGRAQAGDAATDDGDVQSRSGQRGASGRHGAAWPRRAV